MAISAQFLDELRDRTALSDVVGRRVRLVKKGHEHSGLCPFHKEKTPSFTVNDDKGFYHCFAAETRVITWQGTKAIADLAGGEHTVLSTDGAWAPATFKAYGRQKLYKITIGRNRVEKEIFATSGHRWFVRGRKSATTTLDLKPGHRLAAAFPLVRAVRPSVEGIRHGIVFGDGTTDQRNGYCLVNLHMEKRELGCYFDGLPQGHYERAPEKPYIQIRKLPVDHKTLPALDRDEAYLAGFVAGYLATDGHVAKDGTAMLHCKEGAVLQHIRDICHRLGIATLGVTHQSRTGYGATPSLIHRIHFLTSSLSTDLILRKEAAARFAAADKRFERTRWCVRGVEETTRTEEVYCADVPQTHAFALEDNILTGNCFGCGAHGSAFDFVMETEGLNFREAVGKLAADVGMQVPQDSPEERQRAERKKTLYDVVEAACAYFQSQLSQPVGASALKYLKDRGLTDETIKKFRLGFAPDRRDDMKSALGPQGHDPDELVAAGLIIKRDDGSTYDRFRGRVIFPILDRRGRVVAFGGRIMGSDDGVAKYLNSPETDLFHKGSLLYAMDAAQVAARAGQALVVTEGYMDVIVLNQAGFEGAVAPLGTALTEQQINELWKIMPEPVLCFDGDNAGARAATRAAERALALLRAGVGLRFATLPSGEDPDSLVQKQGPAAFQEILDAAKPLSQVLWETNLAQGPTDTPEGRAALQKRLDDHVKRIEDATVRGHFQSTYKDRVWKLGRESNAGGASGGGGKSWKKQDWKKGKRGYGSDKTPVFGAEDGRKAAQSSHVNLSQMREEILLAALITHPDLFDDVGEKLGNLAFSTVTLDNLRQEALKTLAEDVRLDTEAFERHLRDSGYAEILDAVLSRRVFGHAYFARAAEPIDTALAGWNETYELYCRRDLEAEILQAQRRLAADMSPENFERFRALKMQEQTAQDRNAK